ncbi:helix-turn-helix transcriptional regulator [Micromonospora sp. M12]
MTDPVHLVRMAMAIGDGDLAEAMVELAAGRLRRNPGVLSLEVPPHTPAVSPPDHSMTSSRRPSGSGMVHDHSPPRPRWRTPVSRRTRTVARTRPSACSGEPSRPTPGPERPGTRAESVGACVSWACDADFRQWYGPSRAGPLTQSELDVVRLVAQGMTNRTVAEKLFLSAHTVNTHLRHAFSKLGIRSRVELTPLMARHEHSAA